MIIVPRLFLPAPFLSPPFLPSPSLCTPLRTMHWGCTGLDPTALRRLPRAHRSDADADGRRRRSHQKGQIRTGGPVWALWENQRCPPTPHPMHDCDGAPLGLFIGDRAIAHHRSLVRARFAVTGPNSSRLCPFQWKRVRVQPSTSPRYSVLAFLSLMDDCLFCDVFLFKA